MFKIRRYVSRCVKCTSCLHLISIGVKVEDKKVTSGELSRSSRSSASSLSAADFKLRCVGTTKVLAKRSRTSSRRQHHDKIEYFSRDIIVKCSSNESGYDRREHHHDFMVVSEVEMSVFVPSFI